MKKDASKVKQFLSLTTALSLALSLGTGVAWAVEEVPSPAGQAGEQEKTAVISLCDSRTFQFNIPVELTEEEAKAVAEGVVWSLDYDGEAGYLDPEQYPNHTAGGALESWMLRDGESSFFQDIQTKVAVEEGQVSLEVTFTNDHYYDLYADLSSNLRG